MDRLVEVFKAFGDRSRLKIVKLLTKREMCVGEIVEALGIAQSSVSQHLARLRSAKLVIERREGQLVFYRIHEENLVQFEQACRRFLDAELCDIPEMSPECVRLREMDRAGRFRASKEVKVRG